MAFFKNNKFVLTAEKIKTALGFTPANVKDVKTLKNSFVNHRHNYDGQFMRTDVSVTTNNIPANRYQAGESIKMDAPTGYGAIGIVGVKTSNFRIRPTIYYVQSNEYIFAGFANSSAEDNVSATVTFEVLWCRDNSSAI